MSWEEFSDMFIQYGGDHQLLRLYKAHGGDMEDLYDLPYELIRDWCNWWHKWDKKSPFKMP